MKIFKHTYRFFSALTLLLFLSSIMLPLSMSATTLFCDMEMEGMAQHHQKNEDSCCDFHDIANAAESGAYSSMNPCNYQQVCAEVISGDQTDNEAIVQSTQTFVAALVFTEIFVGDTDKPEHRKPESNTLKYRNNEPIFLLNSTFLN